MFNGVADGQSSEGDTNDSKPIDIAGHFFKRWARRFESVRHIAVLVSEGQEVDARDSAPLLKPKKRQKSNSVAFGFRCRRHGSNVLVHTAHRSLLRPPLPAVVVVRTPVSAEGLPQRVENGSDGCLNICPTLLYDQFG